MISNNTTSKWLVRRLRRFVKPGVSVYARRQGGMWKVVVGGIRVGITTVGKDPAEVLLDSLAFLKKYPATPEQCYTKINQQQDGR